MAANICRFASLIAILTNGVTGLGSGLRIVTDPEYYNDLTDTQLNVTCFVDETPYCNTSSDINIKIMKQRQDEPIVTMTTTQDPRIETNSRNNIQVSGLLGQNCSESYLTLTINNPCIEDTGSYVCKMTVTDDSNQTVKESSVTAPVTFDNNDIKGMVKEFYNVVSKLTTKLTEFVSRHDETIKRLDQNEQDIDTLMEYVKQLKEKES